MKQISRYFVNGILVLVPFAITVFVVVSVFELADKTMGRYLPFHFPGFALVVVLVLILTVGWLSSYWFLQWMLEKSEKIVGTIPIVKFIYSNVKQLSTAVFESQNLFKQAVLVTYPKPGNYAVGFLMPPISEPLADNLPKDKEYVCVFIPLSMNMTAGHSLMVPQDEVIRLNISAESALQYVLTAGAVMPREAEEKNV